MSGDKGTYLNQVYIANKDGSGERAITSSDYSAIGAEWSSDGQWIAFVSDSGNSQGETIWLTPSTGGSPRKLDAGLTSVANVKWSPNGTKI